MSSELDSKKELMRALRRDAEVVDRMKADAKLKDREIEDLKGQVQRAEQRIEEQTKELSAVREAAGKANEESDGARGAARGARSPQGDDQEPARRSGAHRHARGEHRREARDHRAARGVANRHSNTILELKRSAEAWKRKYQSVKGHSSTAETSVSLPTLSDTDVRAIEHLEKSVDTKSDATIAIDMRRSLLEARRAAAQGSGEK